MKKLYTLLVIALIGFIGKAQIVNIPDANFKAKLIALGFDSNLDGNIQQSEALTITYMDVSSSTISDLTGINYFTNLTYLRCASNQLTALDISNLTNLQQLYCSNNLFTSLNLTGHPNLYILECFNNLLTNLDITGLHLYQFNCSLNQLSSLDFSAINGTFYCSNNLFTSLDLSNITSLSTLYCANNQISQLNLDGCVSLQNLNCSNNLISTLNLNSLTQPTGCYEGCPATINLSNNNLSSLFLKSGRIDINLTFNGNPNIRFICTNESQISTIQSLATSYGYSSCQVNSYCSFTPWGAFYTIQGNNRYDSDNNGCDSSDINFPNLKFNLTNGTISGSSISNLSGNYSIPVGSGTHTIVPVLETPTYFNISPTTTTITFPSSTSPYTQDFCVTANGTHNDLEVALLPITSARPGFDATYKIIYKNKGTVTQSGTVTLGFDDSRLDFVWATPSVTTQVTNSLSWSYNNLLPFETREISVTLNVNSPLETPAVNNGDVLNYTATATGATDETPTDNVSALAQIVVNSLDPNDKTCLEGTTVSPGMVGEYVHYVVRFENDGTANAQNIVAKDMIDTTKFDVTTLVPLSGSAPYVTKITNTNQVEFIFQNINLPFASETNTGYVAFKIKTKPTLVVGNTFSNTASIFFDYNAPIVTNTYTSTVAVLATHDFDFGTYFNVYPNPAKQVLDLDTKTSINVTSINIYNSLGQMIIVIPNAESVSTIDVSDLKTGTYFIKVNTDKGTANTKFIKE